MTHNPLLELGPMPSHHPPRIRATLPTGAVSHVGLSYAIVEGYRNLRLDIHVPKDAEGPAPVVVWIHGGAWLFGTRDLAPREWPENIVVQSAIDAGLAIATIDYRHARESPFPAQLHDAKAAIRYLRSFGSDLGIDGERVAVWGESAGGHLAALTALVRDPGLEGTEGVTGPSSEVVAAVCYYPVTDVESMPPILESIPADVLEMIIASTGASPLAPDDIVIERSPYPREEARRILSPVNHVRSDAPPFLIVHGEDDHAVPIDQGRRLAAELSAVGATADFVTVPGAGHVFMGVDPRPIIEETIVFLRRVLS